ncbi:MAG: site-2 protease family protein [Coriobacteriales bacterium]|jgi:Zn-dependent protease
MGQISVWTIISIICFIPAIVLHECGHGFAAYKLGDPTAKNAGRLTLNPIKHIDPFGTVILPLLLAVTGLPVFGYAKPVPYNPRYFKNIRKGEVITGLAGPCMNLIMAVVGAIVGAIFYALAGVNFDVASWGLNICYIFSLINLYLMFFNLIPIPPLDGASIIAPFLSDRALEKYYSIQQYAMPILMIVLIICPYVFGFDPFSIYLNATAGNLGNLLFFYAM